ncbi:RDD family protein [Dyella choica]|uniref:RDD family protein n=1 Tax=Dyella choica TaxID=1927959 RepID=A0A432M8T6_9GAMM|nr:RDD family protein [Dyella choica]RUL76824.1 RDD family protein [Dyella choica]
MENNPYAAPGAVVEDVPAFAGDDLEARKAGRGRRLGALLLDDLMFALCLLPVAIPAYTNYLARARGGIASAPTANVYAMVGVALLICLATYDLVLLHRSGQTIGKRLLGIKIVRTDGDRASLARIFFLRALPIGLLAAVPFVGRLASLIDALMIFGQEKRCLHDRIADTIVIND